MTFKTLTASAAALALVGVPTMAAAAPVQTVNPATSLSVSKARVGTPSKRKSLIGGTGAIIAGVLALGVVAGGIVAVVNDDDTPDSP